MSKYINLLKSTDFLIPSLKNASSSSNVLNKSIIGASAASPLGRMNYFYGAGDNHPQFYAGHSSASADPMRKKATTILSIRRGNKVVIIGDGQVTQGHSIVKTNVKKIRRLADGKIVAGFAGSVADAFTLFDLLEKKLTEHRGLLLKSCVELAQQWRTDKYYRRLEASLIVADKDITLNIDGNGDVLEPSDGVIAIGSGGEFALSAARALLTVPDLDAEEIAKRSMKIAADICIYTNHNFIMETINFDSNTSPSSAATKSAQTLDLSQTTTTAPNEEKNKSNDTDKSNTTN